MSQHSQAERPLCYFAQDESRFGLKTLMGRRITACGVKPIKAWRWEFKAFWLYGAVEPATGDSFFLEFSHVDSDCYQRFLDEFAQAFPDSLNILQVDNGRFHKSKQLKLPDNIVLLLQPPYCPELNPAERVWEHLKKGLKWALFESIEALHDKVDELVAQLIPDIISSLTGYPFILKALSTQEIIEIGITNGEMFFFGGSHNALAKIHGKRSHSLKGK